jgi:hypothetical protein
MNVLRRNQFQQSWPPVRPPVTALLDAAPRRLSNSVSVNNFIDHYGTRLNFLSQTTSTRSIVSPDAGS